MAQQVRKRKQVTVAFESNGKVSEKLSRGMVYRELYLHLEGAATVTAGNNAAANIAQGDEWGVVKRIDVIANHTDVIFSLDGNALWWMNFFMFGNAPRITPALGDESTANVPFSSVLILPFWLPNSVRPMDYALDSRQLASLDIEVTWGTYTDINSSASAMTTDPTLKVYSLESFGADPKADVYRTWRTYKVKKEITASNTDFQVDFAVGNQYRGFFMNFTDGGADDGDILNNFKLISGTTVFADLPEEIIEQSELIRKITPYIFGALTGDAYLNLRRGSTNNSINGWYLYDHVTDGYNSEAIDTFGFSEFKMTLDVTVGSGTTYANIYPIEIIPIRQSANGVK